MFNILTDKAVHYCVNFGFFLLVFLQISPHFSFAQTAIGQQYGAHKPGATIVPHWRRDVYNVLDFGATPDDTSDDTAAIQAACTAASGFGLPGNPDYTPVTPGGTVYFPKGIYHLSSTITANHVNLLGSGLTELRWTADGFSDVAFDLLGTCIIEKLLLTDAGANNGLTTGSGNKLHEPNVTWFSARSAIFLSGQWLNYITQITFRNVNVPPWSFCKTFFSSINDTVVNTASLITLYVQSCEIWTYDTAFKLHPTHGGFILDKVALIHGIESLTGNHDSIHPNYRLLSSEANAISVYNQAYLILDTLEIARYDTAVFVSYDASMGDGNDGWTTIHIDKGNYESCKWGVRVLGRKLIGQYSISGVNFYNIRQNCFVVDPLGQAVIQDTPAKEISISQCRLESTNDATIWISGYSAPVKICDNIINGHTGNLNIFYVVVIGNQNGTMIRGNLIGASNSASSIYAFDNTTEPVWLGGNKNLIVTDNIINVRKSTGSLESILILNAAGFVGDNTMVDGNVLHGAIRNISTGNILITSDNMQNMN